MTAAHTITAQKSKLDMIAIVLMQSAPGDAFLGMATWWRCNFTLKPPINLNIQTHWIVLNFINKLPDIFGWYNFIVPDAYISKTNLMSAGYVTGPGESCWHWRPVQSISAINTTTAEVLLTIWRSSFSLFHTWELPKMILHGIQHNTLLL